MIGNGVILLCAFSGVLLLPLIIQILRRPLFAGRGECIGVLCCLSLWCLAYAGELVVSDPAAMIMWIRIQYLGLAYFPAWLLLFSLSFNGLQIYRNRWVTWMSFLFCTLTLVLVWTYPAQTFFYQTLTVRVLDTASYLQVTPAPWYWVHTGGTYVAVVFFWVSLFRNLWNKGHLYRRQFYWFLTATLIPITGDLLYLTGHFPIPGFDPTCILLVFFAWCLYMASKRHRLFDIIPFARDQLVELFEDAVLVTDVQGRVVDMNPAAETYFSITRSVIGSQREKVFPEKLSTWIRDEDEMVMDVTLPLKGKEQWVELRRFPLIQNKRKKGDLFLLRDIHSEKKLELEREAMVNELQEALENVKQLSGLIPICSICKNIRDDKGYWNQLESFLRDHSQATFSHGVCPDCLKKHYNMSPEDDS